SSAAALLKLDDRGVLASGKLADLVVLDAVRTSVIREKFTRCGIAASRRRDRLRRSRREQRRGLSTAKSEASSAAISSPLRAGRRGVDVRQTGGHLMALHKGCLFVERAGTIAVA